MRYLRRRGGPPPAFAASRAPRSGAPRSVFRFRPCAAPALPLGELARPPLSGAFLLPLCGAAPPPRARALFALRRSCAKRHRGPRENPARVHPGRRDCGGCWPSTISQRQISGRTAPGHYAANDTLSGTPCARSGPSRCTSTRTSSVSASSCRRSYYCRAADGKSPSCPILCAPPHCDGVRRPSGGTLMIRTARLALAGAILAASCTAATAQTMRVRGTIEQADGNALTLESSDGAELKLTLTDSAMIVAVVKASMADIKEGTFLGSAAMPQPDGSQRALEVHIFPEQMRGTGEGHRPYAPVPNSTMTNGDDHRIVGERELELGADAGFQ